MPHRLEVLPALAFLVAGLSVVLPAAAQEDVQIAAKAFSEGQQAQVQGKFVRAAELFEIADQAVPSAAAVRSAIRNRDAAGQDVRAATLAMRALDRYPDDRETRVLAEEVLERLGPKLSRIRIRCSEPCTATVDGALVGAGPLSTIESFVLPGPHVVRAAFPGRDIALKSIEASQGQMLEVNFDPPPALAESPRTQASVPAAEPSLPPEKPLFTLGSEDTAHDSGSSGISPAFFWVGLGLTVAGGSVALWSGLDTLAKRDDYEREPTRDRYENGVRLERRTNLLIGATALLGVSTLGIGLFATDFGGNSRVSLSLGPRRVALSIVGDLL